MTHPPASSKITGLWLDPEHPRTAEEAITNRMQGELTQGQQEPA